MFALRIHWLGIPSGLQLVVVDMSAEYTGPAKTGTQQATPDPLAVARRVPVLVTRALFLIYEDFSC